MVTSSAILAVLNGRTKRQHVPAHSGMRIIFGTKMIEILMMMTIQMMNIIPRMRMMIFLAILDALYDDIFCGDEQGIGVSIA